MSSMRNAVQRRNHKERAQPLERQKWGLLEKHKDYSKRAADHNLKKRKIKALQAKAGERNEDEFYFGMLSSTTDKGVKRARRGEENGGGGTLAQDTVALMKTQDAGYLRTVLQQTRRERERLEKKVVTANVGVDLAASTKPHVVFDGDGVALPPSTAKISIDEADEDDDDLADLAGLDGISDGDDRSDDDAATSALNPDEAKKKHRREVQRRKLEALEEREEQLSLALREVEDQRTRMKGHAGGINKNGVKFKTRGRRK